MQGKEVIGIHNGRQSFRIAYIKTKNIDTFQYIKLMEAKS
ncbi:hypothetical protein HMPREF1250_0931 [Megasphaera vaginalis (ex Srinivasan et al. 2021)]|uniref:Uncharacterized protein n=1 Tax=Megasphaera vaginalis (ex Srinivasan et al. 2021) TaxID=1111454 RepID=U7UL10_9FIRM|nr:hypothetical protein HMPREF1250_0931 [Megasphaera vaginalis (ex Srinivasan et al. 2021)]